MRATSRANAWLRSEEAVFPPIIWKSQVLNISTVTDYITEIECDYWRLAELTGIFYFCCTLYESFRFILSQAGTSREAELPQTSQPWSVLFFPPKGKIEEAANLPLYKRNSAVGKENLNSQIAGEISSLSWCSSASSILWCFSYPGTIRRRWLTADFCSFWCVSMCVKFALRLWKCTN